MIIGLVWLVIHAMIVYVCYDQAVRKGQSVLLAILLGVFLWAIGLVIMLVLPYAPTARRDPW